MPLYPSRQLREEPVLQHDAFGDAFEDVVLVGVRLEDAVESEVEGFAETLQRGGVLEHAGRGEAELLLLLARVFDLVLDGLGRPGEARLLEVGLEPRVDLDLALHRN